MPQYDSCLPHMAFEYQNVARTNEEMNFIFVKDFIYFFLEGGGGKERERGRETLMCERYSDP